MLNKLLRLLLFEVARSAEASLAILIAGNKLLCSYRDTVYVFSACDHSTLLGHPSWIEATSSDAVQMRMNARQQRWLQDLQQAAYR